MRLLNWVVVLALVLLLLNLISAKFTHQSNTGDKGIVAASGVPAAAYPP